MTARWLVGFLALNALATFVACAEPPLPKKQVLPACTGAKNEAGCVGAAPVSKHHDDDDGSGTLKTTTGAPLPASASSDEAKAAKAAQAMKDDPAATPADPNVTPSAPVTPPPAASSSSGSVPAIDPPADDDPFAGVGPMCMKLWGCCAQMRAADMSVTADACDDSAIGNDEITCDVANTNYSTPTEFYDPVCTP